MITKTQLRLKRLFDIILALVLLPILFVPTILLILIATIDIGMVGLFSQARIGQKGEIFQIYKIRTLKKESHKLGELDKSATKFGGYLRRTKLDELPQLYNVLIGDMSFVGPRPDIEGFADALVGQDRIVLKVKPGVTGPATIKYRDEERILRLQKDPESYNRLVIWVDKVKINKEYVENYSFFLDLMLILKSI